MPAPEGTEWRPVWTLLPKIITPVANKSFDELFLDKVKGPTDKPPQKRRKIDLMTKVITDDQVPSSDQK